MIKVAQLSKSYGPVRAVRNVSFRVDRGTVVGFLGPNGAGKSTTLRILAGFLGFSRGTVKIGGHDIVQERIEALRQIGYMPEACPFYPEMRVVEYLRFRAELKAVSRAKRAAEVDRVLGEAKASDMADVLIGHLSKGYRQRVGLADALLGSPPLLILDEPTSGLDPNQMRDVRDLIRRLAERHTVLLSTHILSEVEATCDHLLVIDRGRLVAQGPIGELGGGRDRERLEVVVGGRGKRAAQVLSEHELVRDVVRGEGPEPGTQLLDVALDPEALEVCGGPGEAAEQLVFALAKAKVGIRGVAPLSASLEQIFSQLTDGRAGSVQDDEGSER
ncbi:MAG: ABC transporter ATP-binding protein [Deltaproteobacteria bacterium]|nr:ABC transporter ATP-binding protein [Deltaproteobacteria bacterium]